MAIFALSHADGSVEIMTTVGDASPEECIAKWPKSRQVEIVAIKEIASINIPTDRTFRNAWKLNGSTIDHDMSKAREIKRDQLRSLRTPLLETLDVDYQKADEVDNKVLKAEIAAKKQALRDVTNNPAIDVATTPEELKAILPPILKGK